MTLKDFILILLAIFVGVLAALAVAALYAKQQIAASTTASPLAALVGL